MLRPIRGDERNRAEYLGEARRRLADTYFLLRQVFPPDTSAEELRERVLDLADGVCRSAAADCDQLASAQQPLGNLSANPYDPDSISNPYGKGNPYNANSVDNAYGKYGSPYSNQSATNPYATDAPKLYDSQGNYRGKLSANPYDADSVSNPYGRFGSPYSAESINNPFGAGNLFSPDSPTNPFGTGLKIIGEE